MGFKQKIILILVFALFSSLIVNLQSVIKAATLSELQKQAEQAKQQIADTKAATQKKQQDAALLNQAITQINSDINSTQKRIDDAQAKIQSTSTAITDAQNQIDQKQKELEYQQSLQADAIRTLYLNGNDSTLDLLLADKSFTAVIEQNNYLESLETKIETTITQISSLKKDLETKKTELEQEKGSLELYKSQQESNRLQLDSQKSQKNNLLGATNTQIQSYLNDTAALQKKVADLQKQIDVLVATSAWGGDIISADDSSWYYRQLDYQDNLGNSPYTVAQYGCLITSIAMVSTFYGHHVTPSDIANDSSLFDRNGYFLQNYPSYLGVHVESYGGVNWGTINSDLANGYPVIVSIYLPQVGAVNSDGSSHFIVIKSYSNGKYMMHDPIGPNRGYSISQVRSMLRLRPN